MGLKPAGKVIVAVVAVGSLYFGAKATGLLNKFYSKSVSIDKAAVDLPTAPANAATSGLQFAGVPSKSPTSKSLPELTVNIMAWNSQLGLIFANGGGLTTEGSLMEKNGVKLNLIRQDDDNQSMQQLIKFGKDYKSNPSTKGFAFIDMGDSSAPLIKSMNDELSKLDGGKCDYCVVVIGAVGRSDGEDALMGPATWKENPANAIGSVISTVLRSGDANVVLKWAGDNAIPVNPDEKTYDPTAINFVNAPDFVKAGEMYINNYSEDREVVQKGVDMHKKQHITVQGLSSWSPVDYNVAKSKGGLVRIVSTHEYASQMPGTIYTIKKYALDNHDLLVKFLSAALQGGDNVKSYSQALQSAGDISAELYKESGNINGQTGGAYWVALDKGILYNDRTGVPMQLGGSAQYNVQDCSNIFGLTPGSSNTFGIVYQTFAKINQTLYPKLFKDGFPSVDQVLDLSILRDVVAKSTVKTEASTQTYSAGAGTVTVAAKSYHIEFATGSAQLTPQGLETVKEIGNSLLIANGLKASIDGYTDATGSQQRNQELSEQRAQAVKTALQQMSPTNFPDSRFTVTGFGGSNPVGDNTTEEGRAANRRVVIKMTH